MIRRSPASQALPSPSAKLATDTTCAGWSMGDPARRSTRLPSCAWASRTSGARRVTLIEAWLAAEPHLTAVAIVDRLRECTPGGIDDRQLSTLQRFVKSWRAKTAKRDRGGGSDNRDRVACCRSGRDGSRPGRHP